MLLFGNCGGEFEVNLRSMLLGRCLHDRLLTVNRLVVMYAK
jgi:hypothetical protein